MSEMLKCVREVARGCAYFDKESWALVSRQIGRSVSKTMNLRAGERSIGKLLVQGFSSKEIADQLGMSRRQVEVRRSVLMERAGARNAAELSSKLAVQFQFE